jgi:pimeloyl-ACP methyl ester carboxylesterase
MMLIIATVCLLSLAVFLDLCERAPGIITSTISLDADPAVQIAAVEDLAERIETPVGEGTMVWRRWSKPGQAGIPLVLFHGGSGSWAHWIANIPDLARHRPVICADIPGQGDSDRPSAPYMLESTVPEILAGLDSILPAGQRFDMAGFSYGGIVSLIAAATLGERVRTLVVCGCGGLPIHSPHRATLKRWRHLPPDEARAAIRYNAGIHMLHDVAHAPALATYIYERDMLKTKLDSRRTHPPGTLQATLPHIRARLRGIWGRHDRSAVGRFDDIRAMFREHHPDFELTILDGAGHWVMMEAGDRFTAALETWLA